VSRSTQTDAVSDAVPQKSLENIVLFLVKCISMMSQGPIDTSAVLLPLAKEMLGVDMSLPTSGTTNEPTPGSTQVPQKITPVTVNVEAASTPSTVPTTTVHPTMQTDPVINSVAFTSTGPPASQGPPSQRKSRINRTSPHGSPQRSRSRSLQRSKDSAKISPVSKAKSNKNNRKKITAR